MSSPKKKCPQWRETWRHPTYFLALGLGSGYSPIAPGTAGTLMGWLLFWLFSPFLSFWQQGLVIAAALVLGVWFCANAAKHLRSPDPSCVVWDEIAAFWLMLWVIELLIPSSFMWSLLAFVLFRIFDAVKRGPVAWADGLFKQVDFERDPHAWKKAGFGIMFDDVIAAILAWVVFIALHAIWMRAFV